MPSTNSLKTFFARLVKNRASKRSNSGIFVEESRNNDYKQKCLDLGFSQCSSLELGEIIENVGGCALELHLNNCYLKTVPKEVFRCSDVRVFNLIENDLEELSPAVASLLWLEELYLDKNDLRSIPESLKCCKRLRILHLSYLPLIQIPVSIPDLLALTELHLNGCGIDTLPSTLGFLGQLRVLEMRQNCLSALPGALGRLTHLQRVDVGRNRLRSLPETLPTLGASLKILLCDWNELTELPEGFEEMYSLETLDLSGNFFRKLPECFGGLENLSQFFASDNELVTLPDSLTTCSKLEQLILDNNRMIELPDSIGSLVNLVDFSVRGNKLSQLPGGLGWMKNLKMFLCDSNELTSLPSQICGCKNLTILSLRENNLTCLCREIGTLDKLKVLDLRGNRLEGLPRAIRRISDKIAAIWLTYNQVQSSADRQEWSISPGRLYQFDKNHREKLRAEFEELKKQHPDRKSRKIQNEVHLLPSSPRWGAMGRQKTDPLGPPPPIRPYAMVDLKTLQAQLMAEGGHGPGSLVPWYLQHEQQQQENCAYDPAAPGKRASAPVGHYESIFEGLGTSFKPNNANLVSKQRPESHYEKLYDKNEVPDNNFEGRIRFDENVSQRKMSGKRDVRLGTKSRSCYRELEL